MTRAASTPILTVLVISSCTALQLHAFLQEPSRPDCKDVASCRQLALEAASAGEHERFHDLAWRAAQAGPARDPDLMFLLARAQSLSGRPHDAFVTLRRLAEMGVAPDIAANDDFRRVRALPGWAELEALSAEIRARDTSSPTTSSRDAKNTESPEASREAETKARVETPAVESPPRANESAAAVRTTIDEPCRFVANHFIPAGLAYDAVSRRFLVGSLRERKLMIVGEGSDYLVPLASSAAGFLDVMAIEIDARRGDLWVVSAGDPERNPEQSAALHKLQLISGRLLAAFHPTSDPTPARFVDVAVTDSGTVFVLDSARRQIWRLKPGQQTLESLINLGVGSDVLRSMAPVSEQIMYVSSTDGVYRIDLGARTVKNVDPAGDVDLAGFDRIRWRDRSLIGIQSRAGGSRRAVRLRVGNTGLKVLSAETLDDQIPAEMGRSSATLLGRDFFYLVARALPDKADAIEAVVRRVRLP